jgi:hypothetical protein
VKGDQPVGRSGQRPLPGGKQGRPTCQILVQERRDWEGHALLPWHEDPLLQGKAHGGRPGVLGFNSGKVGALDSTTLPPSPYLGTFASVVKEPSRRSMVDGDTRRGAPSWLCASLLLVLVVLLSDGSPSSSPLESFSDGPPSRDGDAILSGLSSSICGDPRRPQAGRRDPSLGFTGIVR